MYEYASICLNAPQYARTCLNITGPYTCMKMPELTVPIMPEFSICLIIIDLWQGFEYASDIKYTILNVIIIVTDVILEFLYARFVQLTQLTFLSFFNISCNINKTKANKLLINFPFDYNDFRVFKVFK